MRTEAIQRLGELLRTLGVGGARTSDLLIDGLTPPPEPLIALERPDDARLAIVLQLFREDQPVERRQVEQAVAPLALDDLVGEGLVEIAGSNVRARVRLAGFEGLILAGDPTRESEAPEYVQALSTASTLVSHVTVRREIGAALDLGTGSGVQALLAARHADRVIGVDISPHALHFATLNQHLNGIAGDIAWMHGDWLEPVRDQRFDLVVANPPYVVSPDNTFVYRDSEAAGDELSRRIVGECAGLLTDGGFAAVMLNWIHDEGDWESPLRAWVAGLGCDAVLLHCTSQDPLAYAIGWNRPLAGDPDAFSETVTRWVSHYRRSGIERIASGFVILRRRSGRSNWTQALHAERFPTGAAGGHLERIFAAGDFSVATSPAAQFRELLAGRWELVKGHTLDQRANWQAGAYAGEAKIGHAPGLGLYGSVDPRVLPLLIGCNGDHSLGELLRETPVPEGVDQSEFQTLCLNTVRDLIARGFLVGDPLGRVDPAPERAARAD